MIGRKSQQDLLTTRGLDWVTITGDDNIQLVAELYKDVRETSGFGGRWAVGLIEILPWLGNEGQEL